MRAALPEITGKIDRDGVNIYYESYGQGEHTIFFIAPWWPLIYSRGYKAQIPYFSDHFRCITQDPRGNGKSDHCIDREQFGIQNYMNDTLAVMDELGVEKAVLFGHSCAGMTCAALAAYHPDRVEAFITVGTVSPLAKPHVHRPPRNFVRKFQNHQGWEKYNRQYWDLDYPDFTEFFSAEMFTEPHSSKQIEDCVEWAAETTPQSLIASMVGPSTKGPTMNAAAYAKIKCPALLIHGKDDRVIPITTSQAVAKITGGELELIKDAGHNPHARIAPKINTMTRDFLAKHLGTWHPNDVKEKVPDLSKNRIRAPKKVLYLSSPIGLGHARRDLAITRELRTHFPDMQVDWLAQDPVTRFLNANNERVHPDSVRLANESSHIEEESGEHDLNAFMAIRNMDEILVKNFMVFQEAVEQQDYDLVIADEAWDVDHYWHEHPELKTTQVAWFTDFVGWVPIPENGEREAFLTTDYNAEMIGHVENNPTVRDRAIFVGNPADIIPHSFGKDLPEMRDWVPQHYDFSGYVIGQHPDEFGSREELCHRFGYQDGEKVCIVTVGGSGVGGNLIRRILAAYPAAKSKIPELRMIVVMGPRLDPATFNLPVGVEAHAFVPNLDHHLAACDLALVQGGLTTSMELVAAGTPFLYFPLKNHFEQNFHVAQRLDRYDAGRKMIYDECNPDIIAQAMVEELSNPKTFRPVESDGAARAAKMLVDLL